MFPNLFVKWQRFGVFIFLTLIISDVYIRLALKLYLNRMLVLFPLLLSETSDSYS